MLILSRNIGECILIGKDVEVRVLAVSGGQVSIGVAAPRNVPIFRSELVVIPEVAAALAMAGETPEAGNA